VRVDELAAPRDDAELYDLHEEALELKPYMTGDVFSDVAGDGDETVPVMIVGHPCVIRGARGRLMTRVPCCVLKPVEKDIAYAQWPEGDFDKLPVTSALGLGDRQAVRLLEWRSVHHKQLPRSRRRATMTERGVYIVQQRFMYAITRCAVWLSEFEKSSRHVMREAEMEYEWVADLVDDPTDEKEITKLVTDFHKLLDQNDNRKLLLQEGGDSTLRAIVRRAIKDRGTGS
jgi:hypothetical protein